jgi:GTPase SAR1 family protein
VRLYTLGDGRVGKTTLLKLLQGRSVDPEEAPTSHVLMGDKWSQEVKVLDWVLYDFPGQPQCALAPRAPADRADVSVSRVRVHMREDYSSNSAFLSAFNACAMVVVNLAADWEQGVMVQLRRWLAQVNASATLGSKFPVVVVGTHADDPAARENKLKFLNASHAHFLQLASAS